ncbi:hypothetical protein Tco_1540656 [Tanacetum coccineum]
MNVVDLDTQAGPYNILGYQNDEGEDEGEDEGDDEGQKQNDKGEDKADNEGQNDEAEDEDCGQGKDYEADDGGKSEEDEAYDGGQSEGEDEADDEDEDVEDIVDEEHIVDEVEVNMNGFNFNFEGEFDDKESAKRKGLRKLKRQAGNSTLKNSVFVGKEFPNRNVANEIVRAHVLETRINIQIVKNDKIRARVKCFGVVPLAVKMTKEMISNRAKEKDMKLLDQCKKVEGDLKELGKAKKVAKAQIEPKSFPPLLRCTPQHIMTPQCHVGTLKASYWADKNASTIMGSIQDAVLMLIGQD